MNTEVVYWCPKTNSYWRSPCNSVDHTDRLMFDVVEPGTVTRVPEHVEANAS